jgi:pimeloyl-ACP methyl ester carboxylesterase
MVPIVASSAPVDGFRLAYDRVGSGPAVVLLHGWPGSRRDYEDLVPLLSGALDAVAPDLRGFGESDRHDHDQPAAYSADGQAASVLALIDELGLERPILMGYDVGSRVAQTIARQRPDAIRALVLSPPLPGSATAS